MKRYTPVERQHTLDRLLDALRSDDRLAGVLIVGSGAVGFPDEYADIDLAVVVERAEDVKPAFDEWGASLANQFDMLACAPVHRGTNFHMYAMLLGGFLELDISFQCLDDLVARRARWRVAWDRMEHSDRIANIMQTSWDANPGPDRAGTFRMFMEGTWHFVNHVGLCVVRGNLWRAINDLDLIRGRLIELAGLHRGIDAQFSREADKLPPDVLAALETTLVRHVDPGEILRALRATVMLFIDEAQAVADTLEGENPPVPDTLLVDLVDLWEVTTRNTDATG